MTRWHSPALFLTLSVLATSGPIAAQEPAPAKGKAAAASTAATDYPAILKPLRFREIGPATMGGRIDDFAVVESNPDVIYVATASGGIFKTVNGGTPGSRSSTTRRCRRSATSR